MDASSKTTNNAKQEAKQNMKLVLSPNNCQNDDNIINTLFSIVVSSKESYQVI